VAVSRAYPWEFHQAALWFARSSRARSAGLARCRGSRHDGRRGPSAERSRRYGAPGRVGHRLEPRFPASRGFADGPASACSIPAGLVRDGTDWSNRTDSSNGTDSSGPERMVEMERIVVRWNGFVVQMERVRTDQIHDEQVVEPGDPAARASRPRSACSLQQGQASRCRNGVTRPRRDPGVARCRATGRPG
jgi:hypothetical protein